MNTLPTSLVRFQSQLEEAVRDRGRITHRPGLRAGLALTAAIAIALGVLGALPGDGPSVVDRATAALRADDGTILHTVLVGTTTDSAGGVTAMRVETWQAGSASYDQLQITSRGGREVESATVNGVVQLYDPQANTIYVAPPQRQAGTLDKRAAKGKAAKEDAVRKAASRPEAEGDVYRAKILGLLETGKVQEQGRVTFEGRDAIRLASGDGSVTLLVSPVSYEPLEWRVSEDGVTAVARFPTYERVAATEANTALLSLTTRHPDAIVDESPTAYESALQRLMPDKR